MEVAMISEHANPLADLGGEDAGGQNVYVHELASELGQRGHNVTVYTRRDNPHAPTKVPMGKNVSVVQVPAGPAAPIPKDLMLPLMDEFADYVAKDWQARPPDVVHTHFWMSGYAALKARETMERPDIPLVHSYHALGVVKKRHQGEEDTSPHQRCEIEQRIGQQVNAILASCDDEKRELEAMGLDAQKMHIVPGGIDVNLFRGERQFPLVQTTDPRTVLSVGRLVKRKGVDTIVEAMQPLANSQLLIAGGPSWQHLDSDTDVQRLRAAAESYGVADRVKFLGRVARDQLCGLMRSADAIVAVPWYEPFGIVPIEAMASGTPFIGSSVGGLLSSVIDGQTGFLVPPRNPGVLAQKLEMVMSNLELTKRIGTAAAVHARTNFSWQHVTTLTEKVYSQLVR